jgi:hypothetical protein
MILRGIYVISTYVNTLDVTGCKQLNVRSIITDCLNEWRRAIEFIANLLLLLLMSCFDIRAYIILKWRHWDVVQKVAGLADDRASPPISRAVR